MATESNLIARLRAVLTAAIGNIQWTPPAWWQRSAQVFSRHRTTLVSQARERPGRATSIAARVALAIIAWPLHARVLRGVT